MRRKRVKEEIQIRINEKKINIIFSVKFGIKILECECQNILLKSPKFRVMVWDFQKSKSWLTVNTLEMNCRLRCIIKGICSTLST